MLLDEAETLYSRMNGIFLKQGLKTPDLNRLSPADRTEWYALYEQAKKKVDAVCDLINRPVPAQN